MRTDKSPDLLHNSPMVLPRDILFIWHGVNDPKNLEFFLKSNICVAEGDVRALEGRLVLRHDPFDTHPLDPHESLMDVETWVRKLMASGKGVQVDLKEGGETMERVIKLLKDLRVPDDRLWLTTNLKDVSMEDYGRLSREFPKVPLQSAIPHRFMFQDMSVEERAEWMAMNRSIGIRHFAISWYEEAKEHELKELRDAGFGVHFFYVNTPDDILKAAVLRPNSITSDFHIPEWGYFGRGSGENGFFLDLKKT